MMRILLLMAIIASTFAKQINLIKYVGESLQLPIQNVSNDENITIIRIGININYNTNWSIIYNSNQSIILEKQNLQVNDTSIYNVILSNRKYPIVIRLIVDSITIFTPSDYVVIGYTITIHCQNIYLVNTWILETVGINTTEQTVIFTNDNFIKWPNGSLTIINANNSIHTGKYICQVNYPNKVYSKSVNLRVIGTKLSVPIRSHVDIKCNDNALGNWIRYDKDFKNFTSIKSTKMDGSLRIIYFMAEDSAIFICNILNPLNSIIVLVPK